MKKSIVVFLTLVLLLTQLTSMTYPTETDSLSVSDDATVSSSARSPYEKIHVYTHPDDENDYSLIRNEEELSTAIQALKSYTASLTPEKALQNEQSDIRITVEFESGFSETKEYGTFRDQLSKAKSIAEVREIRKKLNGFSKKYHAELIKSNAKLLSAMEYDSIDEIGYSPFVIMKTTHNAVEMSDLMDLAVNEKVLTITLESAIENYEKNSFEETNNRSVSSLSGYGNGKVSTWDEMLDRIGAKDIVDDGLYQGEGIVIGVIETGYCDIMHPNLVGKDITIIATGNSRKKTHATSVTSIIALIAPEATVLCDAVGDGNFSIENLINNNCDIINASTNEGSYLVYSPSVDGIIDYQVYHHFITFVTSAGNFGGSGLGNVTSPGRGYNVLTVGGVEETDSGYIIHSFDSKYNASNEGIIKPNLCGLNSFLIPNGANIKSDGSIDCGTSFSAPQVTACIALLLEKYIENDGYWLMPPDLMALVISGAEKTDDYTPISLGLIHFDRRVGAGVLNLNNCLYNSPFSTQLYVFDADQNEIVFQTSVHLEAGETIQVALSMFVSMYKTFTDDDEWVGTPDDFVNYNLFLYSISSQSGVAFSVVSGESNHELLRYTAYTSGDYYIQVKANENQINHYQWLGLAYTID